MRLTAHLNILPKFCPRWWLVAPWIARPVPEMYASTVVVLCPPANFSASVFVPVVNSMISIHVQNAHRTKNGYVTWVYIVTEPRDKNLITTGKRTKTTTAFQHFFSRVYYNYRRDCLTLTERNLLYNINTPSHILHNWTFHNDQSSTNQPLHYSYRSDYSTTTN